MMTPTPPAGPSLVIGVDVGGTNTDAVLLDTKHTGPKSVIAWNKSPTAANVTLGVQKTLTDLLRKAPETEKNIAAVTIGTTHFLNAILEHDASRLEKVAVIRLASYNFSSQTPSFIDWPSALKRIIKGHAAIVPGGCNIDGTRIADIDAEAIAEQAQIIRSKNLKNVVVAGIGSPMDTKYRQEAQVRESLRSKLGDDVNIVCSHEISGSGLLARENAAILNASIINFARRTIRGFMQAMSQLGLRCPLYLTANTGHLLSFSEAVQFPIRIFSSGATNSIRGAAYLAGRCLLDSDGAVVVDIGGTTTDVGFLLRNGYPRLASSRTEIAGIKVNLEVLQVESIALGGGSLVRTSEDGETVSVGPGSVGHEITTKALCFGGTMPTATDIAVLSGASVGTTKPALSRTTVDKARARIQAMLENLVDRVKTSAEPCTVILVGGGAVLCPDRLEGVSKIVIPELAGVANAIGAAIAQIGGKAEKMTDSASVELVKTEVKAAALADAESRGADTSGAVVTKDEVVGIPYMENAKQVLIEVACPADHARFYSSFKENQLDAPAPEGGPGFEEIKAIDNDLQPNRLAEPVVDISKYRPSIDASGKWLLSKLDVEFISIGCYILGCGGGGSPYSTYLEVVNLVEEGRTLAIVDASSLAADAVLVPVGAVGSPAVADERPGGDLVLHALQTMEKELETKYDSILAVEIGGSNGLQPLIWASSKYYNLPCVDGDLMGRAYPNFEKMTSFVDSTDINKLFPVALSSGTGRNVIIPATQPDVQAADYAIRSTCVEMGSAAGATGVPISGSDMQRFGILNTHSLAWRLGRAVSLARQRGQLFSVMDDIIREFGGAQSAKVVFRGKIISVEHSLSATAHTTGKVVLQQLSPDELGVGDMEVSHGPERVVVEFVNENLSAKGVYSDGSEEYLAVVPDLIMLLDVSTGEAVGAPEYRYGLKIILMVAAPHPLWTTERGLEIGGPPAFGLSVKYKYDLRYVKPKSVIEEYKPVP
ncbi:hydantoinase [Histoplasma capsulatum var. duboisii H88]|uniref:Hydantoinase n=2 Tax=Ajellomyces capsulatus (strain H88) TaxID=544711 RepID=A0A8A1LP47_AJEC8|nr:hydantoinase [Histoplasma capsulatum var. duboisii H88]